MAKHFLLRLALGDRRDSSAMARSRDRWCSTHECVPEGIRRRERFHVVRRCSGEVHGGWYMGAGSVVSLGPRMHDFHR